MLLHQHGVVLHLADVAQEVDAGLLLLVVVEVGHHDPRVGRGQVGDGDEMQMEIDHRHIGGKGMGRLGQELLQHAEGVFVHQRARLEALSHVVIIVIGEQPVPREDLVAVHDAEVLEAPVGVVHRLVDHRADGQLVVWRCVEGELEIRHGVFAPLRFFNAPRRAQGIIIQF